ncbi:MULTISPECIES: sensor histidine kinase [unclassified Exiguobacterium]|uniref:sensor histidine kinase n=1 Tax=unclassified Exiguobacterium TaxID=2644629 RepID=UPI000B58FF10|nr:MULTISPECIES: sensor histidine kinase [unclassified Exiguobacterium]ASI36302.1 histidine kinase [Exiguobacterium sp. N4-1P]
MTNEMRERLSLNDIVQNIIGVVEESREEIVRITEDSREQYAEIQQELRDLKTRVHDYIKEAERLERLIKDSKARLVVVSKNFDHYSEQDVRSAYETANALQLESFINQRDEMNCRKRRDELERRLVHLDETIERADMLISRVSVVLNFLTDDMQVMNEKYEKAMQKQEMGLKVFQSAENERRRLSRDMHDGPAQTLAHVLIRADLIEKIHQHNGAEAAFEEIHRLRILIRDGLADIRRIIYDLRPMTLDDLGFVPTLERYLRHMQEISNIPIHFNYLGGGERIESTYEVAVFRIVQEAVQNAVKHSKASDIRIIIEQYQHSVRIHVKDNGIGFDFDEIFASCDESFGLVGMRERIELIDGSFEIETKPDKGTVIKVGIPIEESEARGETQ